MKTHNVTLRYIQGTEERKRRPVQYSKKGILIYDEYHGKYFTLAPRSKSITIFLNRVDVIDGKVIDQSRKILGVRTKPTDTEEVIYNRLLLSIDRWNNRYEIIKKIGI